MEGDIGRDCSVLSKSTFLENLWFLSFSNSTEDPQSRFGLSDIWISGIIAHEGLALALFTLRLVCVVDDVNEGPDGPLRPCPATL
jgi:hypothetical protein